MTEQTITPETEDTLRPEDEFEMLKACATGWRRNETPPAAG
jgi:hypothetical protein